MRSNPAKDGQSPVASSRRALLSVDDAGEYVLLAGERLVVGHSRGGQADLGFLADVGARHAELRRRDSFRDGPRWEIAPLGREPLEVAGRAVGADGVRLTPGDSVRLGCNLSLRFSLPDPASHSALFELAPECAVVGPRHVLLLGEGDGGRVRVGAGESRHVRVPSLEVGVTLHLRGERLEFLAEGSATHEGVSVPLPPPERIDFYLGRFSQEEGGRVRPPFGLTVAPLPDVG